VCERFERKGGCHLRESSVFGQFAGRELVARPNEVRLSTELVFAQVLNSALSSNSSYVACSTCDIIGR